MAHSIFSMKADYNLDISSLPPEHRPDPVYDTLFPYYVELCALSQFRGKDDDTGGIPGHSVMYLHGACRVPMENYPQLCLCEDTDTGYDGVGVTVNRYTKKANWIALPIAALGLFIGMRAWPTKISREAEMALSGQKPADAGKQALKTTAVND